MHGKATHYADGRGDAFQLVADLCHVPGRFDTVESNPGTKADAYAYRQRIYRWRRTVLAILAHPDTKECAECLGALRPLMGRRFNKDWLDYTRFDVVPPDDTCPGWRVRGSVSRPMYGPDLTFADDPEALANLEDMKALIRAATS